VPFINIINIICSWIDSVNYLLITLTKYGQIVPRSVAAPQSGGICNDVSLVQRADIGPCFCAS
jgi:hypothetical protein